MRIFPSDKHMLAGGDGISYQIVYDSVLPKKRNRGRGEIRPILLTAVFFLAFIMTVRIFWPEGSEVLQRVIFPVDTAAAEMVESFVDELRYGVPFSDAAESFCLEIIAEAGIAAN